MKCIDDEIPFEIPQSWCWVRFGSLVIHNPQVTADDEANAAFMPMTLIDAGYGSSYTYETMKWGTIKTGFTKIATGDIAYAKITPCFQNRKSFILGEVPGGVAAATTELNVIRTYAGTLDGWYILYFLKSEYFIKEARYKGTAGQQRVLSDYVQNKLVPLPPLNEQKRIVQKIQEALPIVRIYGKSQEALDKLNADIFDKLKKSVLQEAIQGNLVSQDQNDEPASILLERIKEEKVKLFKEGKLKKKDLVDSVIFKGDDNKYYEKVGSEVSCIEDDIPFEIPSSWCWVRHNELFDISGGSQPPKSSFVEFPKKGYIRLYQIRDYGPNPQPVYIPISSASKISQKGDILLARYGASLGKVFYAEDGAYNVAIAKVIPQYDGELIYKPYIYLYYCSSIYQKEIKDRSRCAQAGFNKEDLNSLLFPLPPYEEQVRIVERYEFVIASIMRR